MGSILVTAWRRPVEELYSAGLPDQNQQVSIEVVSAMLAVRWLEANADTSEQETAVPTPEQCTVLPDWHSATFRRNTKRRLKALTTKNC